jgi:RNA polymerase sigma-70 factor (ECF subfamily)
MPVPSEGLFERFGAYLRLLAELLLNRHLRLRAKLAPSDIVQETLLRAHQKRDQFRGKTDEELKAWLRQILTHVVSNRAREFLDVAGRDAAREVSLQEAVEQSSGRLEAWLAADQSSPSQRAQRNEQMECLARALESLPEHQRQAVVLHYFQGMTLEEVSAAIGKSLSAVGGLLKRGLRSLRLQLEDPSSGGQSFLRPGTG